MVDVTRLPDGAFGYVPTPALVAPIEFTLSLADYRALGGYVEEAVPVEAFAGGEGRRRVPQIGENPWPLKRAL
jgi:hypothetical protein